MPSVRDRPPGRFGNGRKEEAVVGMSHTKQTKKDGQTVEKLGRKRYEKELARLQGGLVRLQEWVVKEGTKVCIVFEGRDPAGKGGVIKRITERVSPACSVSSRSPRRPSGRRARCTSSATCRTFRRPARS